MQAGEPGASQGKLSAMLRRRRPTRSATSLAVCCAAAAASAALAACFVGGRGGAPLLASRSPRSSAASSASSPSALAALSVDELTPLASYVLVRPKEAVSETKGGILLSVSAKDKPNEGEVLAVGPGTVDQDSGARTPVWAEVGKNVMYSKYGAEKVTLGNDEYALVNDRDILLSYEGEEPSLESLKMPHGKLLVRLREEVESSEGGILLSKGAAKPDTTIGEVVAVSDGVRGKDGSLVPLEVEVGDAVRFRYGSEVKLEVGKAEFRAIDAEDCLAKWKE